PVALLSASRRRRFASASEALSVPRRDIRSANLMATFGILFHLPAVRGGPAFPPHPAGRSGFPPRRAGRSGVSSPPRGEVRLFLPAVRGGWREAPGGELNQ